MAIGVEVPDIRIYLPDRLYMKIREEENKSKLIQDLLDEYYKNKETKA